MNGNRKRNRVIVSVVGFVGSMVLVWAVVFVETFRTLEGHRDGPPLSIPTLIGLLAAVTGVAIGVRWRRRRHNR